MWNQTNINFLKNPLFKKTNLAGEFEKNPLGFVDIGSTGGPHDLITPIAGITNCLCFEPNSDSEKKMEIQEKESEFARLTTCDIAVGEKEKVASLNVTRSEVNSSLLSPSQSFVSRYRLKGFEIKKRIKVQVKPLDRIIKEISKKYKNPAELIKLDCQGGEYQILKGARKILASQCQAIFCEVEFFQAYQNQKCFSEVEMFLRKNGFILYGLYPNYISGKYLDRRRSDTNERLMWADAFFLKDPLAPVNKGKDFSAREIMVQILVAILMKFYDFAFELAHSFIKTVEEKENVVKLIEFLASRDKLETQKNMRNLIGKYAKSGKNEFVMIKKFIDRNSWNNNYDFLPDPD